MKNALIRLREHYHELAGAERTVAEYILKNPETASTLSVQELAHKSFSSPSAVGDRSETHKFHLLMHHILRRRCAFPPSAVAKSRHFSPHAPLASSSRLLRFQTSPSTRPIPPHTSVFSGSFIHNYPLPQVINPTFLPTYRRHIFET